VNWPLVGIVVSIVAFVIARIWMRRWIVKRWLHDDFTNMQAGALLFVTQLSPMLVLAGMVLVTSPSTIPFFLLLIILVAPIWIATWGALFTYMANYGVKEKMRRDREARLQDVEK
jgi:hypothetical protein